MKLKSLVVLPEFSPIELAEFREQALGLKEIIELPEDRIQDRFGVREGEGATQLFFGSITQGMTGGGFLYTNQNSLSLGLVVGIHDLMQKQPPLKSKSW